MFLNYLRLLLLVCAVCGLLGSVRASAQGMQFSENPSLSLSGPEQNGTEQLVVHLGGQYVAPAKLSNGLGSSEVFRTTLSAKYGRYAVNYRYSHFNWQAKDQLPSHIRGRVPWENLHDLTLQGRVFQGVLWDRWHYWLAGEISSAFEKDFPGAVGVGLSGELAFDFYEGWMLGVVARTLALNPLNSDLFGEGTLSLAVHVSQKQLRQALRELGIVDNGKKGSERVNFSFAFTTSSRTYRLAADNALYSNGYMALVGSKVGAYLNWEATDHLTLTIGPEYIFSRTYRLYNSKGSLQSSHTQAPAIGASLGMSWHF